MKPHNKRYSKVNIPTRPPIATPTTPDPVMLDATKRKQLPAWIREGLEKMERDKQKQLEKEREKLEKEDQVEKSKLNEKEALEIIKSTVKEREKSRFVSLIIIYILEQYRKVCSIKKNHIMNVASNVQL